MQWRGVVVLLVASASAIACADATPHFGQPGGLQSAAPPPGDNSGGGGDAAVSPGSCTPAGDASACPTYTKDIAPLVAANGNWGCASSQCHGGSTAPKITGNADTDYAALSAYSGGNSKPYINPGSNQLGDNSMLCDLGDPQVQKCASGSVMPEGKTVSAAEYALLEAWVGCCSPK